MPSKKAYKVIKLPVFPDLKSCHKPVSRFILKCFFQSLYKKGEGIMNSVPFADNFPVSLNFSQIYALIN